MKKRFTWLYITLIITLMVIPSLGMLFVNTGVGGEKRMLAPKPSLFRHNSVNENFRGEFEEYFTDNFAFRQLLVTANSALYYYLLNDSPNQKVIAGKKGFLFFEETVSDYIGDNLMTKEEIDRLIRTLTLQQEYLLGKEIEFLFMIVPNKNTIYSEYMPSRYKKIGNKNLKNLLAELQKSELEYLDLKTVLLRAKDCGELLYHKKDSHWNNFGSLYGYQEIMEWVQRKKPLFKYTDYNRYDYIKKQDFRGDLEQMLFPALDKLDEQIYYPMERKFNSRRPILSVMALEVTTQNNNSEAGLLMFRDSFANTLIPLLSNEFRHVQYLRTKQISLFWRLLKDTYIK